MQLCAVGVLVCNSGAAGLFAEEGAGGLWGSTDCCLPFAPFDSSSFAPRCHLLLAFPPRRLLSDLEGLDWADSIKEMQRNWIGRSEGATIRFQLAPGEGSTVEPGALGGCPACAAATAAACLHILCCSQALPAASTPCTLPPAFLPGCLLGGGLLHGRSEAAGCCTLSGGCGS